MPTYKFDISELEMIYKKREYSNYLIKSSNFIELILSHFLGSAYGYLNLTKKIPIFRKKKPKFSEVIKESHKLFLISDEEKEILENLRNLRNDAAHDLHFDKKVELGEEIKCENLYDLVKKIEKLFIVIRDRFQNFNNLALQEHSHFGDINEMFARRNKETLKILIEKSK